MSDPNVNNNDIIENTNNPRAISVQEMNNVYEQPTLIEIKKIDNSLTKNDFDISTKFTDGFSTINVIEQENMIALTITGKNNATGKKVININLDKLQLFNLKNNIKQGDITAPSTFKVANPQEVNQNDLYEGIKPNILSTLKNKFKVNLKESDFIFTCLQPHFTDSRTTFDMSSPTEIQFSLDGRNWTVSGDAGRTVGLELTMPAATKK